MATGILGQADIAASTNTTLYTVPASTTSTFNLNLVNRGPSVVAVRISISASGTPANEEYIEYDWPLGVGDILERTGIVAGAGENVVIFATAAGVSANVYGYEV